MVYTYMVVYLLGKNKRATICVIISNSFHLAAGKITVFCRVSSLNQVSLLRPR